jgi:hypothetical protein
MEQETSPTTPADVAELTPLDAFSQEAAQDVASIHAPAMSLNTDAERLAYTQSKRAFIVQSLMPGTRPPGDMEDRAFLIKALDGMDKVSLTMTRISADKESVKSAKEVQERMIAAVKEINNQAIGKFRGETALLDALIPDVSPVNGETSIGIFPVTYNELFKSKE